MIRTAFLASLLLAAAACHHAPPAAETPKPEAPKPAANAEPRPVITGGYAPADASTMGFDEAKALAIAEVYKREPQRGIAEKVTGQVQVVAGLNYEFDITMTGANHHYKVVVYKPLQGAMQVTSFTKLP
jgi:hypothetical protein